MSRCEVLQWLREAAHFLQGGMRVSWFSAAHEGSGKAERSCELSAKAGGAEAMEANMADTCRASGWRRAGRRGADGPPWSGRACSGWGPRHLLWVQQDDLLCLALSCLSFARSKFA